jgi:hypothetical protein
LNRNDESGVATRNEGMQTHYYFAMQEYEIYLPTTLKDGSAVDPSIIAGIKSKLSEAFGGYTHLKHRSEGAWRIGGVTFHDEITILRVIDNGDSHLDMVAFKKSIEASLEQDAVLITSREISTV